MNGRLKRVALALISIAITACGGESAAPRQLVITDPGGEWQQAAAEAFYTPFERETGIEVVYSARPALALGRLKAMVESGNTEWDLTILTDFFTHRAARDGLIEAIPAELVDSANMVAAARMTHGVGNDVYATVFAYNTKKWPAGTGPQSWADFWDIKRFPGRRSLGGIGYGPLEFALLADGVPMNALYPLDVPRALAKMDAIKPHINVWWTTGAQQAQLMMNEEVDLIMGWSARLQSAIDHGAPYVIQWNGGMYSVEGWTIPKGARNRADAEQFIRFALRPDRQAAFVTRLPYGPVNTQALTRVPAKRADDLPTFKQNFDRMFATDAVWISEHSDEMQSRWTSWKVK